MNGIAPAGGIWQEARNSDGRAYYYNTETKATQWTKPEALMSPAERALLDQPWKEYTAEGGRKYWYNTETKASSWEMPEVYKNALAQQPPMPAKPVAPSFVAGGGSSLSRYQQRDRDDYDSRDRQDRPPERQQNFSRDEGLRNNFVTASANEPDYGSFEEAEAAFFKLLKRSGVESTWSWEQAMKAIIKDPQYRALKDPKERKAAFEKYVIETRLQDKEREKERQAKLKDDFEKMLKSHPEIRHYTRWKTARPIIEGETIFRSTGDDTERRQLYETYIISLRKANTESDISTRKAALDELTSLLKSLDLDPYTRWSDAQGVIGSTEQFQKDDKFKSLTKSDVLTAFENHIKSLERTFNDSRQLQKSQQARVERQHRDQFVDLLRDLRQGGKIKAGTKWMDVQPLIEDDPRYVAILGQKGSTPLDLFWDIVEDEERALRGKRNEVLDVLDDARYEITPLTTLDEFMEVIKNDRRTSTMSTSDLTLIFSRLHEKVLRRNEEDKHQHERQQRRAVDALRSRIKHLDPPVRLSDTWEDVQPLVERYDEYQALKTDELRRSAFEKVIKRLKEKELDVEEHSSRRSDRYDRRASGRRSHHSRSPEPDAYEADRRRAQERREQQYRKSSTGASPPLSDSRRRDRDDRYESRRHGSGRLSSYSREPERLERDFGRPYPSRADPRDGPARELDYGDSSAVGGSRRRRESVESEETVGRREAKRVKREDGAQSKTPLSAEVVQDKEDENLRSGSEEGEIEED